MQGSSPAEALNAYLSILHRVLSCVTREVLQVASYQPADTPQSLFLNGFEQARLQSGQLPLALRIAQQFQLARLDDVPRSERWRVTITEYHYAVEVPEPAGDEILAFHWHPERRVIADRRLVSWPHLHIGDGELRRMHLTHRKHIPTQRVAMEDVLEFIIDDAVTTGLEGHSG